jgi:hypothetical protein
MGSRSDIGLSGRLRDKRPSEVVARSLPLLEASMARLDQAVWVATANIARFRELLDSPVDEYQRHQLEGLLTRELAKLAEIADSKMKSSR